MVNRKAIGHSRCIGKDMRKFSGLRPDAVPDVNSENGDVVLTPRRREACVKFERQKG